MRIFISPVGTSILTNFVRKNKVSFKVYDYANFSEGDFKQEDLTTLYSVVDQLKKEATTWNIEDAKAASAELNGLLSFDTKLKEDDLLYFIITDTLQSKLSFEIVNTFLESHYGITGQKITLKHLTTKNKNEFLKGIKELLRWSNENLSSFKANNYSIFFNLTGGFKSLLGYLTPIGMFYADSIFYIFETGDLIEIPKLPITVDDELFSQYAKEFLLMSAYQFLSGNKLNNIPKTLLEEVETDIYGLSVWGELMWDQIKQKILPERLIQLPNLKYEESFKKDFISNNSPAERIHLQETLAKVSSLLSDNANDTSALKRDNGLSYENCKIKKQGKTIGHFRYNQRQRVSCIADNAGLILLRNGFHDVCD